MTHIPFIPQTAPFTPEQRAWLNGFLAGLFAQGVAPQTAAPPSGVAGAKPGEPLLVLFGSQTGTAEGLARQVAKEAQQRGFAPSVFALDDYDKANLAAGGKAVLISSTWGDGDPPDNAVSFWNWLNADSAPRLDALNFAVLGLGDKNYSDFCGASKKFDARLETLGARRLVPRGECDADYETAAKTWLESLWAKLGPGPAPAHANGASNGFHRNGATPKPAAAHGKSNPFPAKLLRNVLLNKPGSTKEVRHYEVGLAGSGLAYEAGDALGVVPANCVELVDDILAALRCKEDKEVRLGDSVVPLRQALTRHFEITRPSQELLAAVAAAAPASELARLVAPDKAEELKRWLWGRDVIDLLHLLPQPLGVTEFVGLLRKLAPRLYSISSSPKAHPDEAHLTVSALRYESYGRRRKGVASTFLAERAGDTEFVRVFVQPSPGFKPPPAGEAPMIMVGPGTGIAPFRAFLEERQASGASGKNWLFFGDQTRACDFFYEEQLTGWQRDGLLTRLDLAFSRDQAEKVYVQHRMLESAAELWSWLEAGAHFYVCGDASRMARDVEAALLAVIEKAGQKTADDAKAYVAKMKSERRYQRDVY